MQLQMHMWFFYWMQHRGDKKHSEECLLILLNFHENSNEGTKQEVNPLLLRTEATLERLQLLSRQTIINLLVHSFKFGTIYNQNRGKLNKNKTP